MTPTDKQIRSVKDAQRLAASIVAEINRDSQLAIAAAANPLFALEELGYEISPNARKSLEDRIRFGEEKAAQIETLRAKIFELVGHDFDLESEDSLRDAISELKIDLPAAAAISGPLVHEPQPGWASKSEDPLAALKTAHPAIELMVQYRMLETTEPRLASRALYDEIRHGRRRTPLLSVRAVLQAPKHRR